MSILLIRKFKEDVMKALRTKQEAIKESPLQPVKLQPLARRMMRRIQKNVNI